MRDFTEEQEMFRKAYRRFLECEVAPNMASYREQKIVDRQVFLKAGEQGFLMIWPDEEYGGMNELDFRYEQIIIEELARADCSEFFASLHSRMVGPYLGEYGSEEQKQRFLPGCVSGETILAVAMTEPDAGSDLAGMRTVAIDQGDHYLLNGAKTYISNGINADLVVVAAKTDPDNNPHHMSLMLVERGMEGFDRGRKLDKMGMDAQDTAELFFHNVRIPKENVLGEPGKGFYYLMERLCEERLMAAVGSIASTQVAFEETRRFVSERNVFGKSLANYQNTQFKMAEVAAEIDCVQAYVDYCVGLHNQEELDDTRAAKAKLLATELEGRMTDLGVQLHGGAGYMNEYRICRMFKDTRVNRILAGSSEIMKLIIGRQVFSENYRGVFD